MIFACCPVLQQIAIVRALRIARFARDIGRHRPVPIGHVENLPVRSAVRLLEPGAAGRVDREPVTRPPHRAATQLGRFQRMLEIDLVQPPPLPAIHLGTLLLGELLQSGIQCLGQGFRMRIGLKSLDQPG